MTRMSMLYAYTLNAAMVMLSDKSIGSIQPGKVADLVLVDRDLSKVSSEDLAKAKILWTMFRGQIVYTTKEKDGN